MTDHLRFDRREVPCDDLTAEVDDGALTTGSAQINGQDTGWRFVGRIGLRQDVKPD